MQKILFNPLLFICLYFLPASWPVQIATTNSTTAIPGTMRITEYMYNGLGAGEIGEFVEFTNVGNTAVDMTGWSFDDNSRMPGSVSLGGFGMVQPGESVILAELTATAFRANWGLCNGVKVVGGNTNNLGRSDEINLYDASNTLIDRLTYNDQGLGGPRTNGASAWISEAGLGANVHVQWTRSTTGDVESSSASSVGEIGSPGRSTRAAIAFNPCPPGAMRITEYMYNGLGAGEIGEFVEFTNVGTTSVDMTGWSFDDNSRMPGSVNLSGFGMIQPGESVILTELTTTAFRTNWALCNGVKVIGGNTNSLGRSDEINLYDASNTLVDRLTYNDQGLGGPRTNGASAWVSASALGANIHAQWTRSVVADVENSYTSSVAEIGSPGKSSLAIVSYKPCTVAASVPTIVINTTTTTNFLDGGMAISPFSPYAISGVINDPTDPAKLQGIDFSIGDDATPVESLIVTVNSNNTSVVPNANLNLTGSGASRNLKITPSGVGYAAITVLVNDGTNTTSYVVNYASSSGSVNTATTRFHTGASDASTAQALGANFMLVADDENQVLRLYDRQNSGLPLTGFDYSVSLGVAPVNPEVDIEASVRLNNRIYWLASHSNSAGSGELRPNRYRLFATDVSGTGAATTLSYVGRYDALRTNLISWDANNIHGLGANYFGFAPGAAAGNIPEADNGSGFNIEGLTVAPDNTTAYICFRGPTAPANNRTKALIVPLTNLASLVTGNPSAGAAIFGTPILLELGGLGIREIKRNASGQYLIIAGPASGGNNFRLYTWSGIAADAPILRSADLTALNSNGSFESIVDLPDPLLSNSPVQLLVDNGDAVFYNDGIMAKDLADNNHKKFRSEIITPGAPVVCESAAHQAYVANTTSGNQAYRGELGMEFIVNKPSGIIIKQLGAFDDGGNGITGLQGGGVRVAIFNRNTHTIVQGLDVIITGNADHYSGNHRMKEISPVTLPQGDYIIVAKGYHASEQNGNSGIGVLTYPSGDDGGGAVTFGNETSYGPDDPNGFSYPNTSANLGATHRFLAGTFAFTTTVPCGASGNANLSQLVLSQGTLAPLFTAFTTAYTSSVPFATASVTAMPTSADAVATITVNGLPVTTGTASGPIPLNIGSNVINVVVTAPDGTATKTYTVTMTRAAGGCETSSVQAYATNATTGTQAWRGELGMRFTVNGPGGIIIKQLGAFDDGGNGITGLQPGGGVQVAIFNRATHTIVPGLDVTVSGNADHYTGNHRMVDIAPVILSPGDYVIVAKGYHTGERNGNGTFPAGDNSSGAITFENEVLYGPDNQAGFAYPITSYTGNAHAFNAGTFVYTAGINCAMLTKVAMAAEGETTVQTKDINIYPNPARSQFTVQLHAFTGTRATIEVIDQHGRLIEQRVISLTGKTPSLSISFDLHKQAAGIYFVRVSGEEGVRMGKVVLVR